MDIAAIARAARQGCLRWRAHALERMLQRGISRASVLRTLEQGEVIEDYPDDRPFPSALLLGFAEGRPLHVVVALDATSGYAHVVTVYEPDLEHFESDFRTRRER
ncbi:MAG: DUF4258 domain-containing protein [Candidatus Brocadiia bacterium]